LDVRFDAQAASLVLDAGNWLGGSTTARAMTPSSLRNGTRLRRRRRARFDD